MSRKNTMGPDYFRLSANERLMRTHETVVDLINGRHPSHSYFDVLSNFGCGFVPELDSFANQYAEYVSSDEDYYDYDDDKYAIRTNNRYCGFPRNFLERVPPKPSKHITAEEAERNAKELVDEEEKLKKKAEKKKQKKMRQKERRRLEKLEKENADKEKNKPVQVDPGLEKTKHSDKNENKIKNKNYSSVPPGSQRASAPVQSSDSSSEDEDDEDSTIDPEELDMSSCFVSNAAAIAKRKLEQKPKHDKKHAQATSKKQPGSEQKDTSPPQKQINNKEENSSEDTVNANYFITRSVELAVIGNQYASAGNLDMAVKYFTDAIKHNPQEYKLFGNRSYCYEKMLQYEKALNDADIALSMNPKWVKGLYRKGKALVGLKRYYEARLTYNEVLKLDSTCKDAAEEMMRVQLMQLMEMGFTKEQSSNALILHGTVEKALESLSGLSGLNPVLVPGERTFMSVEQNPQSPAKFPLRPLPQNQSRPSMPPAAPLHHPPPELFPVWVGDLVPSITAAKLYELFSSAGHVHKVRVLQMRHCAFVNYTKKEDCEKAIRDFHGYAIDGTTLVVRYPDRIHTRLGVSRDASTESSGKNGKQPDECYFWRTNGCVKNERCTYKHIPENKGIDRNKANPNQ
ncbi:tetratricopeptide repeat protein 31 [Labeo rohita]|uniref:tetratricopeptide repeat protein 31 n=1 Tax=Labeo rohita TaxID=84645 RepID=UPI0021E311EA|nr:tetratricopeptide repeat protein 31 [Labeo rohita]